MIYVVPRHHVRTVVGSPHSPKVTQKAVAAGPKMPYQLHSLRVDAVGVVRLDIRPWTVRRRKMTRNQPLMIQFQPRLLRNLIEIATTAVRRDVERWIVLRRNGTPNQGI